MTTNINTLPDVMVAIATAIKEQDEAPILEVEQATDGWMIGEDERIAINNLVDAAWKAIGD